MKADFGKILLVMGVAASGKTTLGKALAKEYGVPFFDGDDYHPPENIKKMASGIPLEDADREGWLHRLNALARSQVDQGAVIACSALKERYREWLREGIAERVVFVVLHGTFEALSARIASREGHFMPAGLLRSQFDTLELPGYGIHLDCSKPVPELIAAVRARLD